MMQGNSSGSISIRKKSKPSDPGQPEPGAARDSLQDRETASVDIADHHISVLKERAADDLRAFFDRKGVPRPRADEFKIHINYKGTCDGSYSVHYSDRRGEMYLSRSDVYASLDKPSDKKDHIQVPISSCRHKP